MHEYRAKEKIIINRKHLLSSWGKKKEKKVGGKKEKIKKICAFAWPSLELSPFILFTIAEESFSICNLLTLIYFVLYQREVCQFQSFIVWSALAFANLKKFWQKVTTSLLLFKVVIGLYEFISCKKNPNIFYFSNMLIFNFLLHFLNFNQACYCLPFFRCYNQFVFLS